jgi:uncharacterized membrane protein YoaK (UPF0700 family)
VVFLGFAAAGAPEFSMTAALLALGSFGLGAVIGGRLGSRLGRHRGRLLSTAASLQAVCLALSAMLAARTGNVLDTSTAYGLIVVLGVCMGIQNATARKLAVPDLTTTVLTLTVTGIAADSVFAGGTGAMTGRRFTSVGAMLVGAFVGAEFVVHGQSFYALVVALVVLIVVAATAWQLGKSDPPWVLG